ncbi:dihydroneopterin aldolase [Phycicoccus sp. CSK15P-2]|uniref:dihydroneopterin aldolase n=1 Tax=Phycicoccus sp. CSK15P-2 TaxID=2807627 RepID=UPI0019510806|nr:dihydroneopterin aldolase [Phycicoccus sp. CSK15P-2]MBM6405560.1 dihydroneopterin aldolase [Phycicoccus sp. CSK15P-2]
MATDRITLRGVRATGFHGVFEHERRDGQEFVVDVVVTLDLAAAGRSDDLADTFDYGALAAAVVARVEGEAFDLVERLATVIADDVLADVRVEEVEVTVHKPQAPITVPFDDVAVTVVREREQPVVVALGSNLPFGDVSSAEVVLEAADAVGLLGEIDDVRVSGLYVSDPVGGPQDQPSFVNAVLVGTSALAPTELLELLHDVEWQFDRTREVRWGPRTLDLDLVQYGDPGAGRDVRSDDPELTLPHPRAHERAFVLVPWLDVDPEAVLRVGGDVVPVARLVEGVDVTGLRPEGDS